MKDKRFEAAVRVMAAFQADPTNEETIEADATHAVECADALLAALGESAPDVPELPVVRVDHAIACEDGDVMILVSEGAPVLPELRIIGQGDGIFPLTPPQLLELAALCIAHYREMTKGGAS